MSKPWFKYYEQAVPHNLEYPDRPLHTNLELSVQQYPNHPAIIYMNRKMTFAELGDLVDRLAAYLVKKGVGKGDRVALYMPNCPQYVIGYYAALKIGAIVVPCNPLYVAREIEHQLNDAGAKVVIVLSSFYPTIKQIRAHTQLEHVIVAKIKTYFPPVLKLLFTVAKEKKDGHAVDISNDPNTVWFEDTVKVAAKPPAVQVGPSDTACLMYTGGTTGVPKGAELTHGNLMANGMQIRAWIHKLEPTKDSALVSLPLFHSYGMTTCMNLMIALGGTMILVPNPRDLKDILKNIEKHKPTLFPGVPTMYVAVNNYPDIEKYDLSSIDVCVSGAAALPQEVQTRFNALTGANLVEGYGLSEASPVTHVNPVYSGQARLGCIGLPWPDTDSKVVDILTGKELPPNEPGELAIQGPQVMKGYWNMPEETAAVLRDGWLYTGDIAIMDEDGFFKIVDRKKDMIIAGGFNIYPREIEEVLYEHPKVLEAVAAGIPDEYRGETVKAYIILREGETATEEEIIDFCRQNLAKYKVPRAVEFRKTLPKSMVGKILRRMLVEEEKAKQAK